MLSEPVKVKQFNVHFKILLLFLSQKIILNKSSLRLLYFRSENIHFKITVIFHLVYSIHFYFSILKSKIIVIFGD